MLLLADENIPLQSVHLIRNNGYNIISIMENSPGITDNEVLMRANKEKRILLTFDRDYGEIIYKKKSPLPAGLIYFRFVPVTPEHTAKIFFSLVEVSNIILQGKFTIVEKNKVRQRPLEKHRT